MNAFRRTFVRCRPVRSRRSVARSVPAIDVGAAGAVCLSAGGSVSVTVQRRRRPRCPVISVGSTMIVDTAWPCGAEEPAGAFYAIGPRGIIQRGALCIALTSQRSPCGALVGALCVSMSPCEGRGTANQTPVNNVIDSAS